MASVGDRVKDVPCNKRNVMGVIKFIGEIPPDRDVHYGIEMEDALELDDAKGDRNGCIGNVLYFKCKTHHGVFVKASDIHYTQIIPTIIPNSPRVSIGDTIRCIKARCGGVIRFIGTIPSQTMKLQKAREALEIELERKQDTLADEERYKLKQIRIRTEIEVIRAQERADIKHRTIYGVELEKPYGNNDGTLVDRVYFQCAQDHGVFITHCDMLQISISFNDEMVHHHNSKLSSVRKLVSNRFEINGSSLLSYKDKHGDDIDIKNEYDFIDALQYVHNENLKRIILFVRDETSYQMPLSQFSVTDICDAIKQWVYNDIRYQNDLHETIKIFTEHNLSGDVFKNVSVSEEQFDIISNKIQHIIPAGVFNKWIKEESNTVTLKSAQEIARILYDNPLNRLLHELQQQQIDGGRMMTIFDSVSYVYRLIRESTRWNDDEIEQIRLIFMKYCTLNKEEFYNKANDILNDSELPQNAISIIMNTFREFDVEDLQFRMKNNKEIDDFSDVVMNMVRHLEEQKVIDRAGFVESIYTNISECFASDCGHKETEFYKKIAMQNWICYHCGNRNFCKFMNGEMNYDVSFCTLCGVSHVVSVNLKIRRRDSFLMVNEAQNRDTGEKDEKDEKLDDIDKLMQKQIETLHINLFCPDRNDNTQCPSILSLAKHLIQYNRWLYTVNDKMDKKQDITKTVAVDISCVDHDTSERIVMKHIHDITKENEKTTIDIKFVIKVLGTNTDNICDIKEAFRKKNIFCKQLKKIAKINIGKCAIIYRQIKKITKEHKSGIENMDNNIFKRLLIKNIRSVHDQHNLNPLIALFNDNTLNINIETFCKKEKAYEYFDIIQKHTKIKTSIAKNIYKRILRSLKKEAQNIQFGKFLSDLEMDSLDHHFHHILRFHINNADPDTLKHTFMFFNTVIHSDDTASDIAKLQCISVKRRTKRDDELTESVAKKPSDSKRDIGKPMPLWYWKVQYVQSELDIYHSYLAHSEWKEMLKRHTIKKDNYNIEQMPEVSTAPTSNEDKYVSGSEFAFGVEYVHTELSPQYKSIHEEITHNNKCQVREEIFCRLLIKAIRKHRICKDVICTYFDHRFQIQRNDIIGIRHILSIIMYTDLSIFCKSFRATYRNRGNKTDGKLSASLRHCELYHYARSLFESIEFFGECMALKDSVYHGLSIVLRFAKFSKKFDQPLSTTTDFVKGICTNIYPDI